MTKYNILCLIANHTCNNIKYNISLNNILLIKKYLKDIIIIDSKNESYAKDLHFEFKDNIEIKNFLFTENNFYDFGKWIFALENINYKNYDYILFLNDSIILTENIDNYFNYIKNVIDNVSIYAYNDSTQIKYHYKSYCFLLNISIINKFIDFFYSRKNLIVDLDSPILNIELYLHTIDDNRNCFLKIGNDYNMSKNIYCENELYKYLLSKNIFGIMEIKKIYDMQKEYKITIYGDNIENFNYDFYKTYYDDINYLSDNELLNHFIEYGQYEGRRYNNNCNTFLSDYYKEKLDTLKLLYFFDIPNDFDIYYYKKYNDDIKYLSHIDTMLHYIEYGYYEGRIYNKVNCKNFYLNFFYLNLLNKFNNIYIYDNDDLNNLNNLNIYSYKIINEEINDYPYMSSLKHYLLKGKKQKLLSSKKDLDNILINFDANIYKSIHCNLSNLNNLELIKHYIKNNSNNKFIYKLPSDFDYNTYKNIYNDLSNLSDKELSLHYILYGMNEGRIYKIPDDFDSKIYKNIYNDLSKLNDEELKNHYLVYGYNEKRIYKIPNDFNCSNYKKIYKNLNNLNDEELISHYLYNGIKEKRIYKIPDSFDCNIYRNIYTELLDLDDDKIKEHYLSNIEKDKIYELPNDFNPRQYKNIYNDLSKLNDEELKNHYLVYGINEKRIYKIPEDFDPIIYKKINNDLKNLNNDKLIEHYLVYGINENRKYKKQLE